MIVSIPHRRTKNGAQTEQIQKSKKVSIPHRRTKNAKWFLFSFWRSFGFQSLIGELKTGFDYVRQLGFNRFQSLIGELKTKYRVLGIVCEKVFQSLIGELKTLILFIESCLFCVVSIPHRRTKNQKHTTY